MVLSQGVRRLMGRRRAFLGILETYPTYTYSNNNCNYNNYYYNSKTVSSGRFISFGSQTHFTAKDECVLKKEKRCKKGDTVNLSQLLFTANRDYLVRYNDPRPVTAEQLAGKVIVLFFVPLPNLTSNGIAYRCALMDTYNDLKSNNCFEVVLVVVDDVPIFNQQQPGKICSDPSLEGKFDDICSQTPSWPAIPFSDITSRQRLKTKLGISVKLYDPKEVLIDSKGMVLDTFPQLLFQTYGSEAYPFSDKRISFLKSRDKTAFCQPSLTALLGSSGRDFVISNTGYKVPIYTLEDKVVALYFYEAGYSDDFYTVKLKMYYEELRKNNQNFEVVLLYLSDTCQTEISTNEETFWKTFSTMPWLALPFKDSAHKKLRRLFGYPYGYLEEDESIMVPTLVIVGPRTEIIEPGLATILRGYDPNLFMREEFAKVERERVWEVKLEMLCSPETVFKRKDGSQVQFSQLAGMRIIFLFEGDYPEYDGFHFRKNLKEKYMNMKGTADEFEVIYFPNSNDKNGKRVADVPWLVSCSVELLPGCSAFLSFYGKSCNRYQSSFILAFDHDGSLVRRMICPQFGNTYFPFYADNCETEASDLFGNTYFPFYADDGETEASDLSCSDFCWGYWDTLYQGLLRKSRKQINFTGSHEVQHMLQNIEICSDHENCEARRAQINMTKGFVAKEPMKWHTVNVVRGLKLYDEIFTDTELSKLTDYVNELRVAGQNGELSGETFIMYNQAKQQVKGGNKRELIQLGAPIFGPIKEESNIEPIPATLQGVIDHLVLWHLISENRKPNSCIINFFDEGEFSQPFLKPPHIDQPISTLLLSESEMAFGRTLVCDNDGNYKGSLMLSLKEGSLLVMRGNSADVARHVMCSSPSKRISITFFRVRTQTHENISTAGSPMTGAMTLWQPGVPNSYPLSNGAHNGYEEMNLTPKWGVLRSPMVMLAPVRPMVLGPKRMSRGGTGVFLPWNANGARKHTKHLPPRAQKGRFLALPPPVETHKREVTSDAEMISIETK